MRLFDLFILNEEHMNITRTFFSKFFVSLLVSAPLCLLTNCCKDSDPEPWYNPAPVNKKSIHDVYVALSYDNGPNTLNRAGYYHKGELVTLNGQAYNVDTYANSIYIDGDDVFVAGMEDFQAIYWKNGEANYLPQGTGATGIVAKNGNVYICGYEASMDGDMACCWINNKRYLLDNGTRTAGITVDENGKVYIVGYYYDRTTGVFYMRYWTDAETESGELARYGINSKTSCEGRAICLDYKHEKNGHPFICLAGMETTQNGSVNKQWVERRETSLASAFGNEVSAMAACNGKVYTCGNDVKTAKYWVTTIGPNGEGLNLLTKSLTDGTLQWKATGISALEDDVYVTGYEAKRSHAPVVWKNGEVFFELTDEVRITPSAIYVVARQQLVDDVNDSTSVKGMQEADALGN